MIGGKDRFPHSYPQVGRSFSHADDIMAEPLQCHQHHRNTTFLALDMESAKFVKVIVDAPLPELDYLLGDNPVPQIGDRVLVQLGSRKVIGLVTGLAATSEVPANRIKSILKVFKDVRALSQEWLQTMSFAADYYLRPKGEAALSALPTFFRQPPTATYEKRLERLREIKAKSIAFEPAPKLNAQQQAAADAVAGSSGYAPFLLFGVTGSGKTEVYLHIIESVLARDLQAQVMLLVPEINLTPQLEARVRARFSELLVVTMHSNLTQKERAKNWLAVHEGRARILVGTRMAVFASFAKLSLIIVDEEHDPSYKAGEGMRFSARDVALKRAFDNKIACVLGSATPSLETWQQMRLGNYKCLTLTNRAIATANLPTLELIDVSKRKPSVFADEVKEAVTQAIAGGGQVLIFINRRGYAPVISCSACGWVSRCMHCSSFTVFHKAERRLVCHHCGRGYGIPVRCPSCGNTEILPVGTGTQRIEEAIEALWPDARVLRIDRDSVRSKSAAESAFESVHAGDVDIVVGTQMISKGHDFKRVSLVVVLNADAQLVSPDIRAEERLFATLMQVAGRAGRADRAGLVMIQTRYPDHPVYADMQTQNYEQFAHRLLKEREESALPPFCRQALLTAQAQTLERALGFLRRARDLADQINAEDICVYEPVPMSLMRLKDLERGQLLVESSSRARLHAFLRRWMAVLNQPDPRNTGTEWTIEVDPSGI